MSPAKTATKSPAAKGAEEAKTAKTATPRPPKADAYLGSEETIAKARAALADIAAPGEVGEYLGLDMVADRLANLRFAAAKPGYPGWNWVVTVARVPRGRTATVDEAELLPGPDALLAPPWIPWADRLQPGDLGPGDVLPHVVDDPRLEPGYAAQKDEDDEDRATIVELGLGRARVLSPEGRSEAATRWYTGAHGPDAPEAVKAAAPCSTCGFMTPLAGSLRAVFGVCTNEWSNKDGQVVSYDHGCGAHSETDMVRSGVEWPAPAPLIDDSVVVPMDLDRSEVVDARDVADAVSEPAAKGAGNAPTSVEELLDRVEALLGAPRVAGVDEPGEAENHAEAADPGPQAEDGSPAAAE